MPEPPERELPVPWRRALLLGGLLVGLALLAASDAFQSALHRVLEATAPFISRHRFWGAVLFVLASALSAMLAFFSSALLLPVALHTWGKATCVLLLWTGWLLGGACSYGLARYLGRPVIRRLTSSDLLARYEDRLSRHTSFGVVLLFQLAVPSEIPGYVLGLARYGLRRYLPAVALAELPYAVGTVYLGASFLEQRTAVLVVLGLGGIALGAGAFHLLRARLGPGGPRPRG